MKQSTCRKRVFLTSTSPPGAIGSGPYNPAVVPITVLSQVAPKLDPSWRRRRKRRRSRGRTDCFYMLLSVFFMCSFFMVLFCVYLFLFFVFWAYYDTIEIYVPSRGLITVVVTLPPP